MTWVNYDNLYFCVNCPLIKLKWIKQQNVSETTKSKDKNQPMLLTEPLIQLL